VIVFGRRRRKPPGKVRPALERNERVLAWAPAAAAGAPAAVVATNLGLWLPGHAARLGWHQVHKATWSGSNLTVVPSVRVADGIGSDGSPYTVMADDTSVVVSLSDPDDVPAVVRKRVTQSVAFTAHFPLSSGGVRVVARRVAGVNGLVWHVRYDEGADPADPEVQAVTAAMVAEAAQPLRPE
jgi:hypothetical protein